MRYYPELVKGALELRADLLELSGRNRSCADRLAPVMKEFFRTHEMFTDDDLRAYCVQCYGPFTEEEYRHALAGATDVFEGMPRHT